MATVMPLDRPSIPVKDGPGMIQVAMTSNGHLHCPVHTTFWCAHIQQIVSEELDAPAFWKASEGIQTLQLQVPMMPSFGLWDSVRLKTLIGGVAGYSVSQLGPLDERDDFIGFIHPGECRRTLRSMLFDWFQGVLDQGAECQSSSHRFQAQVTWEKDTKEGKVENTAEAKARRVAQYWSVWGYKKCLTCLGLDMGDDFSDLVPEADRPGFPRR